MYWCLGSRSQENHVITLMAYGTGLSLVSGSWDPLASNYLPQDTHSEPQKQKAQCKVSAQCKRVENSHVECQQFHKFFFFACKRHAMKTRFTTRLQEIIQHSPPKQMDNNSKQKVKTNTESWWLVIIKWISSRRSAISYQDYNLPFLTSNYWFLLCTLRSKNKIQYL